jgi:hypothetical protein
VPEFLQFNTRSKNSNIVQLELAREIAIIRLRRVDGYFCDDSELICLSYKRFFKPAVGVCFIKYSYKSAVRKKIKVSTYNVIDFVMPVA